jgi:IclR family acetate operon transcriptional repressor
LSGVQKVTSGRSSGGVQSLDRAFMILGRRADAGGVIGLCNVGEGGSAVTTIHRLIRHSSPGYVRQEESHSTPGPR